MHITGGLLPVNHKAGIYFRQPGAIVDGTQILETIGPDAAGIMAVGSVLHKVVNAELDASRNVGIQLIGSTAVIGWDTLHCHGIGLAEITMPAGYFSITQPPQPVPSEFTPLFGDTGAAGAAVAR